MDNILSLHRDLAERIYRHGGYQAFKISDPKPRDIHKAVVRDRLLHHAIYRQLYPFFDRTFIADSYSCRRGKGTHRAVDRFRRFAYKVSRNHKRTCWVLKCDIRKFFASIDQRILLDIVARYIPDTDIIALIVNVVASFSSEISGSYSQSNHETHIPFFTPWRKERNMQKGLPLGNLTSQLLVNVYMNEFDQFVKHKLKARYYVRYADDFVILSGNKQRLQDILPRIKDFLSDKLKLQLHPDKVSTKTVASGVDFLGWVLFPDHRVLRTSAKRRMLLNVREKKKNKETVQSYLGMLSHGNTEKLRRLI